MISMTVRQVRAVGAYGGDGDGGTWLLSDQEVCPGIHALGGQQYSCGCYPYEYNGADRSDRQPFDHYAIASHD
jgi:hypothetical protein